MSTELMTVSDMSSLANVIAKSGLFGMKTPEQALALMAIAQAEGLHPAAAARDYHIIQGRPSLRADAMLARFQAAGGTVDKWTLTDTKVEATFHHPAGGTITLAWTFEQAKKAGLTSNPTWSKYPRAMLRARVVSEAIRTIFPGVVSGFYTPEEVQDMEPAAQPKPEPQQAQYTVIEPSQDDNLISRAQAVRMFAISGKGGESIVKSVLLKHGFTSSKDVTKDRYEEICLDIQAEISIPSQNTDAEPPPIDENGNPV